MQRSFIISLSQEYYSEKVCLSQYDSDYTIVFEMLDKGAKAPINGMTAYFEGTRCDGLSFRYSGTASDNFISFTIDTALTAVAGRHTGEIVLYDGSGLWFGSANVQILVEKAARPDNAVDADVEEARSIAEQIQEIVDTAAERVEAVYSELADRVTTLEQGTSGGGVPASVKQALLTLLKTTAYTNTGLTDEIATIESWASSTAELVSISASYSGGTVRAGTSLDSLRSDLTVIASYEDSTTETVTGYTLSGTLAEGTQTVTVSYGGKTDTFTVTVVSGSTLLNSWDFTQGLTDSVGGKTATTTASQDATGLHFTAGQKYAEFPTVYAKDRTYEIDVSSIQRTSLANYGRLFMVDHDSVTGTGGAGYILTADKKGGDLFYIGGWESSVVVSDSVDPDGSYYNSSTVGFYIDSNGKIEVYKDGTKLGESIGTLAASYDGANVYFGSSSNSDTLYNATFTAFRVYDGNKYGGA